MTDNGTARRGTEFLAGLGPHRFHYFTQLVRLPVCTGHRNDRLGRLTDAMAGRLLQRLLSDRGVSWSPDDIRLTARSTHGVPLLLHHAAAAAVGERAEVR